MCMYTIIESSLLCENDFTACCSTRTNVQQCDWEHLKVVEC